MAAKTDFVDGQVLTAEQLNALGTEINTNAAAVTAEKTRATAAEALKANTADVGDKANLTTTEKGSLVGAINELNAKPSVSDAGDVTFDSGETYADGSVGKGLTDLEQKVDDVIGSVLEAEDSNSGYTFPLISKSYSAGDTAKVKLSVVSGEFTRYIIGGDSKNATRFYDSNSKGLIFDEYIDVTISVDCEGLGLYLTGSGTVKMTVLVSAGISVTIDELAAKVDTIEESLENDEAEIASLNESVQGGSNYEEGYIINSAGAKVATSGYCISKKIELDEEAFEGLRWTHGTYISGSRIAFYTENGTMVDSFGMTQSGIRDFSESQLKTAEEGGAKYAIITFESGTIGKLGTNTDASKYYESGATESLEERITALESSSFPSVVFPSKIYALAGVENSIYHRNVLEWWNPYEFAVNTGNNNGQWQYQERCFRIPSSTTVTDESGAGAVSTDATLSMKILNVKDHSKYKAKTVPTILTSIASSADECKVLVIGDSFTFNGLWFKYIADTLANITLVGMRKSYNIGNTQRAEGRGGWRLETYFTSHDDVTPTHMQPFSPFLHPSGYKYYGVVEFWAAIVNGTSQYDYGTSGFDDYKTWFGTDGKKLSPTSGDVMYDGTNAKYIEYDGTDWVDSTLTDSDFVFDFEKYLSVWNISTPDVILVMLGTNDFASGVDQSSTYWDTWQTRMTTLCGSVHATDTNIKVGICTPAVASDSTNNSNHRNPIVITRYMWEARRRIIEAFDTTDNISANTFVVDTGVCLDPDYGFTRKEVLPFEFYSGTEREIFSTNGVHPSSDGYKQLGVCAAAFVEYVRNI